MTAIGSPVSTGDKLKIAARDWNKIREGAGKALGLAGDTFAEAPFGYPATMAKVKNISADAFQQFDAVGLDNALIVKPSDNLQEFKRQLNFSGVLPLVADHTGKFGIMVEPLAVGAIGNAVVAGACPVGVSTPAGTWSALQAGGNVFADVKDNSTLLAVSTSGSARVLWCEDADNAHGWRWAYVRIGIGTVGVTVGVAKWIRFTLASTLTTSTASVANCTVDGYWNGTNPGSTVTVYNLPASTNYIFAGASGHKGLATYDDVNSKYWIVQLECP